MAVKRYNPETNSWEIFPGTAGDDAYVMAQINGYEGSKEDYIDCLVSLPSVVWAINNAAQGPVQNSDQLITAGGVWSAVNGLRQEINNIDLSDYYSKEGIHELLMIDDHDGSSFVPAGVFIPEYNSSSVDLADYEGHTFPYSYIISKLDIDDWEAYKPIYRIGDWSKTAPSYTYKINWTKNVVLVERIANITKQASDSTPPISDSEQEVLNIYGKITYLNGVFYANKEVEIKLIGNTSAAITVTTDSNGTLSFSQPIYSAPSFIQIISNGETKDIEVNTLSIDFGTWILNSESPEYITRGQVNYKDGRAVSNASIRIRTPYTTEEEVNTDSEGKFVYSTQSLSITDYNITLLYEGESKSFNIPFTNNSRDLGIWVLDRYSEEPALIAYVVDEDNLPISGQLTISYQYPSYATVLTYSVASNDGYIYHTDIEANALDKGIINVDFTYNGNSILSDGMDLSGWKQFNPHVNLGTVVLDISKLPGGSPETLPPTDGGDSTGPVSDPITEPIS